MAPNDRVDAKIRLVEKTWKAILKNCANWGFRSGQEFCEDAIEKAVKRSQEK